ncbi:ADL139Wp [Eremothecium gossypii ATCC 10895]|uniref:KNR4/SMI1 homolog n=1 Tax=Eremothecium gossypii (strain ATCC 10895 / CBS 109.51 / FGSC 9923 / NRRL Y-1056) TaxID=284811 RepID=SMI1_EREGS|nr:ADL139Wp [Eremothecium gossypii ATCC 10895]Q75AQ9.2 RecName: Full=KNR4/SMI1 homolog [Eremothecium gossypii ATCC 10895]AAS51781.2 ADL139Wp [Eremothecium gossypii ATCC 10895]
MESLKRAWNQLVYTFSTEDRYAEYTPQGSTNVVGGEPFDTSNASRIQLNEFVDGAEVGGNDGVSECLLAWRHIDSWCSEHNPDLYATLSSPCTNNDIMWAEKDLAITFPAAVRASLRTHDGQEDVESMQGASGLIYGLKLMGLEEVVIMTRTWRNVAANLQRQMARMEQQQRAKSSSELPQTVTPQAVKQKGYGKVDNQDYHANPHLQKDISQNYNKQFKLDKLPKQGSIPPLAIQPVYAHPGWIPLVTDHAGNHIGVDLAPGPKGKYAQVILFGREFDTKFVVADNWGDFLLGFVNDLEKGNWLLVDNTDDYLNGEGDLVFVDHATRGPILNYLAVLKKRSWEKWQSTKPTQPLTSASVASFSTSSSVVNRPTPADAAGQARKTQGYSPMVPGASSNESVSFIPDSDVIMEESNLTQTDASSKGTTKPATPNPMTAPTVIRVSTPGSPSAAAEAPEPPKKATPPKAAKETKTPTVTKESTPASDANVDTELDSKNTETNEDTRATNTAHSMAPTVSSAITDLTAIDEPVATAGKPKDTEKTDDAKDVHEANKQDLTKANEAEAEENAVEPKDNEVSADSKVKARAESKSDHDSKTNNIPEKKVPQVTAKALPESDRGQASDAASTKSDKKAKPAEDPKEHDLKIEKLNEDFETVAL